MPTGPVDPGYGSSPSTPVGSGLRRRTSATSGLGRRDDPHPSHPIYIPERPPVDPGYGIPENPPTVWPPLRPEKPEGPGKPPGEGHPPGHILVWVPGYGYRWVKVGEGKPEGPEKPEKPGGGRPPTAQPKPA